eukprot:Skav232699  [mRNA]  locus=scaffold1113:1188:1808:- [translate_table: standard]
MCRYEPEIQDEEAEEVQEFTLAERMTFLEYVPVGSTIRKSYSSPSLLTTLNDGSQKSQSQRPWSRQESASTVCSSGWSRQVSGTSCWTLNEADEPSEFSDEVKPDFAFDFEILEIQFSGSDPGSPVASGQWSVGAVRHAQGDCKPCAWFWRPGGCTRGEACQHCHLCPRGALQKKKRQNRQVLRAARAKAKAKAQQALLSPSFAPL